MTTLIEVRNSDGVVGRCDAKCYNATGPDCDCVCGGANHGKGLENALATTEEHCLEWLEEAQPGSAAQLRLALEEARSV